MGKKADKKKAEEKARAAKNAAKKSSSSSKSSKSSSSKAEKKATKQITKYYDEKSSTTKKGAAVDTERLKQDLAAIYQESGIKTTRAIEDYNNSIGDIEANKTLDNAALADYVKTNSGRTQEDLDTSLAKETRRYTLEQDQINSDLADKGLTFSERTPEKVAQEGGAQNIADINTEATRSFQDIARYEAAKTAELELKYGTATRNAQTEKGRTLEDVTNEQTQKMQDNARKTEDVASGLKNDLSTIDYSKDTDVATTKQLFQTDAINAEDRKNRQAVLGY